MTPTNEARNQIVRFTICYAIQFPDTLLIQWGWSNLGQSEGLLSTAEPRSEFSCPTTVRYTHYNLIYHLMDVVYPVWEMYLLYITVSG